MTCQLGYSLQGVPMDAELLDMCARGARVRLLDPPEGRLKRSVVLTVDGWSRRADVVWRQGAGVELRFCP